MPQTFVSTSSNGVELPADNTDLQSPETYIGYGRGERFASEGGAVRDRTSDYKIPGTLELNQWALGGTWLIGDEQAVLKTANGSIAYRFHARDLHLVLGPGEGGKPVRFRVTIDGKPPGLDHGVDTDEAGSGIVTTQRLYQLVRQTHDVADHRFAIEFFDSGAQAFAFTFG